jgi:uncharacterized protein with GYD domain
VAKARGWDKYVVLIKYTPAGARNYRDAKHAQRRREAGMSSLSRTLGGRMLAHYATFGAYDQVFIMEIPPRQDITVLQCLLNLHGTGDFEVTLVRAFDFDEAFPTRRTK